MPNETRSIIADLCTVSEIGDEGRALLREGMTPKEFVALLMEKEQFADAVRLMAHSLPKRESVWWAWVCARRSVDGKASPAVQASLDATEKWIAQPTDEHRRAAMKAAEAAQLKTPAGCAGLAAFLSGGSLAPKDLPAVAPSPNASAKAVAGAIMIAAVSGDAAKAPENYRAYLTQGMDVATRIKLW